MDLIQILRRRITILTPGDYTPGLQSVLRHVEVAANHLLRGTSSRDETAFTDTIYRTNQAFEGSLKEAYRVLAGKDPSNVRPFDIETYLQENAILRNRVLTQLSTYRKEWRNPSAHDYKLDFDEDEALLAIVTVCAFSIMLIDQISEKLTFDIAKAETVPAKIHPESSITDIVAEALIKFKFPQSLKSTEHAPREVELLGALSGYLTTALVGFEVVTQPALFGQDRDRIVRPDLMLKFGEKRVLVELKQGRFFKVAYRNGVDQLSQYVAITGIKDAILYAYSDDPEVQMIREDEALPGMDARLVVIRPQR